MMNEPEQTITESKARSRSRLGCAVGLCLVLVFYVLSHPWVYSGIRKLPSETAYTCYAVANVIYIPFDLALETNRSFFDFYNSSLEILYQTFPGYFDIPILLPVSDDVPPVQIDPPP